MEGRLTVRQNTEISGDYFCFRHCAIMKRPRTGKGGLVRAMRRNYQKAGYFNCLGKSVSIYPSCFYCTVVARRSSYVVSYLSQYFDVTVFIITPILRRIASTGKGRQNKKAASGDGVTSIA